MSIDGTSIEVLLYTSLSSRMDDIYDFMKSRNVSDDIIQRMQQDKVFMKLLSIYVSVSRSLQSLKIVTEKLWNNIFCLNFCPVEVLKLCLVSF